MKVVRSPLASLVLAFAMLLPLGAAAESIAEIQFVESALGTSLPTGTISGLSLGNGKKCSLFLLLRTPKQVVKDLQDALTAGDIPRAMCNYAPFARVLDDFDVTIGRDAIGARLAGMYQLYGKMPTFTGEMKSTGEVVMSTWELFLPPFVSIPDAVDTFVVRFGQIHYQTGHAMMPAAP